MFHSHFISSLQQLVTCIKWSGYQPCAVKMPFLCHLSFQSQPLAALHNTQKHSFVHFLPLWCGYGRRQTCPREVSSVPPSGQSPESVLPDAGLLYRSLQGHIPQSEPTALQPPKACLHWCTYSIIKQSKKQCMSNTTVASKPLKQAVYTFKGMKASDYQSFKTIVIIPTGTAICERRTYKATQTNPWVHTK